MFPSIAEPSPNSTAGKPAAGQILQQLEVVSRAATAKIYAQVAGLSQVITICLSRNCTLLDLASLPSWGSYQLAYSSCTPVGLNALFQQKTSLIPVSRERCGRYTKVRIAQDKLHLPMVYFCLVSWWVASDCRSGITSRILNTKTIPRLTTVNRICLFPKHFLTPLSTATISTDDSRGGGQRREKSTSARFCTSEFGCCPGKYKNSV